MSKLRPAILDNNVLNPFYSSPGPGGSITRYTQLMWADTYLVGCAAANLFKSLFVICNYGPRGNIVSDGVGTVYKRGPNWMTGDWKAVRPWEFLLCPVGTRREDLTGLCDWL